LQARGVEESEVSQADEHEGWQRMADPSSFGMREAPTPTLSAYAGKQLQRMNPLRFPGREDLGHADALFSGDRELCIPNKEWIRKVVRTICGQDGERGEEE